MGQQNRYKSFARVVQAFVEQRTWAQAALARHVGISAKALHTLLEELQQSGMKLHRESDPPQVYWSVEKSWYPGGILLSDEDYPTLLRAAFELPESRGRRSLLGKILGPMASPEVAERVSARKSSESEDLSYDVVQAALLEGKPLRIRYLSQSRGAEGSRIVSPQKLISHPHARLVAWCHQAKGLRWFRLDNVLKANIDETAKFIAVNADEVNRMLQESVDGFHEPQPNGPGELGFFVRFPEANWVKRNLLSSMRVDESGSTREGLRIVCGAGGTPVVARFIVGLGEAARAEGALLSGLVLELAAGATRQHAGGPKRAARSTEAGGRAGGESRAGAVKLAKGSRR